jgi:DNA-binding response OmpR family regulator
MEVLTAQDAAAALREAQAKRPDAALVDVRLPDRSGIDLARQLMALPWRPRVLLTSTDPDAGRLIESRSGAISVPFIRKEDLADATLRELLIGR